MDLGIKGRKALVCASSQGLGLACAKALAQEGCTVWINGRDDHKLQAAATALRQLTGATVHTVVADLDTGAGRQAGAAGSLPGTRHPGQQQRRPATRQAGRLG